MKMTVDNKHEGLLVTANVLSILGGVFAILFFGLGL
jgi:hypothetical protein